jgi:hypothetical protein
MRHILILSAATIFAAAASAQFASSPNPSSSAAPSLTESSSLASQPLLDTATGNGEALPSAPAASGSGAGQAGGSQSHSLRQRLAFEAGGGFNGPTGDSSPDITWGGQFALGAGLNFSPHLAVLAEYQFLDDKLPGKLIAETGASGGYAHIWSATLDPVVDLFPKASNDLYVTGGGGFYRKVTSFTDPQLAQYCNYYYCGVVSQNVVVGHFSSNQGGWNVGAGYLHRMGGMYGESRMKLFGEVRYLDVMSPASAISPNGLGVAAVSSGTQIRKMVRSAGAEC